MTWVQIQTIEKDLLSGSTPDFFNISVDGNLFIDGTYICMNFVTKYNAWYFPVIAAGEPTHNLVVLWQNYVKEWKHSIEAMYHALYANYEPLHNYDMTESESVGRKIDKTVTTPTGTTTQNYKSTTFDDTTLRNVDETTNTSSMTTTVTPANTQTIPDISGSFNNGETRKLTRSGNIGVTTSQRMIESEIEMRKKSVANWLIEFFVKSYMYMLGDVEYE